MNDLPVVIIQILGCIIFLIALASWVTDQDFAFVVVTLLMEKL